MRVHSIPCTTGLLLLCACAPKGGSSSADESSSEAPPTVEAALNVLELGARYDPQLDALVIELEVEGERPRSRRKTRHR